MVHPLGASKFETPCLKLSYSSLYLEFVGIQVLPKDPVYKIQKECLQYLPENRIHFSEIVDRMEKLILQMEEHPEMNKWQNPDTGCGGTHKIQKGYEYM